MNTNIDTMNLKKPIQDIREITGTELIQRAMEEIPTLLKPVLNQVGLACLCGSSDTGKSAILRQLAMSVSAGLNECFGFKLLTRHKSAIYVATEDDENAESYLLNKQNKDLKIPQNELKGLRFIFDADDIVEELDRSLTYKPADLVIIDCFTDLYLGSMNESNQVRSFLNQYSKLANKHQCLVLFLHHCGKRTEEMSPSKHNLLGSQAFEAKMRVVLELRNDLYNVSFKHLCCVKGNYLPAESKTESTKLRFTDNLTFVDTGERVPFEDLVQIPDSGLGKYQQIQELRSKGLTYDEIAKQIGFAGKSSVSKYIKRYKEKHPDVTDK